MDIRAQRNHQLELLRNRIEFGLKSIQQHMKLVWTGNGLTLHLEQRFLQLLLKWQKNAIIETLGEGYLAEEITTPGSDDFHFYTVKKT